MARTNPWSLVSAAEYEAYMGPGGVDLLAPLSTIFAKVYAARQPRRLAVLGVATGNGLEQVAVASTGRTVGVDVNLSFLGVARQRFMRLGPSLELLCADLEKAALVPGAFDLVHAALVLEYVDVRVAIPRIASWLAPGGALAVVLQLPAGTAGAAEVVAPVSVRAVADVARLVPPEELRRLAAEESLVERRAFVVPLPTGRRLFAALYERPLAGRAAK
ncbi:MAG TPA: class I SAM-dependent methyltransferase [Anaeromyxobacteraceae bacterium]